MPQALRRRPFAPFGLPRLLYETLRVACFPVGVRSAQVAQGNTSAALSTGSLRTSSVQVPND
ncbi:hypothetical protein [Nostoc sp.]|uniref:hypothetical protein n=1 Tax=Nostoc sp. TaxID=1180 RepID=UPI002FF634CC